VKREGDGRSPAGAFALGSVHGYAAAPGIALQLPYQRATADVRCVDDPGSVYYNQIVSLDEAKDAFSSAERMLRDDALYELALDIEHNRHPVRPGHGSCIFAHLWSGSNTPVHGCTGLAKPDLQTLLTWLRPGEAAWIALPESELAALHARWGLPGPP
jgi:D-alanyl-D-alanine dipeptidase